MIAKFSSSTGTYNVVKSEFVAMRLAAKAGLDVAPVHLPNAAGRDVLLVERFDRATAKDGWTRKAMVLANRCAWTGRQPRWPRLRRNSRLTVEGDTPTEPTMLRIESPLFFSA